MIYRLVKVLTCVLTFTNVVHAQNINSPYSIFGLGSENIVESSGLLGMGNTGIANNTINQINLFNPASFGNISSKTFIQEFGVNGFTSTLKNTSVTETATKANVSHVAFAFSLKEGWGLSFGLLPFKSTGYSIDIIKEIEGSTTEYNTRITGSGGLNKFYLSTGKKIGKKLNVGLDFSVLFGSINQDRELYVEYLVNIDQTSYYKGLKLTTGFQYNVFQNQEAKVTLGGVVEIPTVLSGRVTSSAYKTSQAGYLTIIEDVEETSLQDFEIPLAFGFGLNTYFKQVNLNLDFKRTLWSDSNDHLDENYYTNQNRYGFGMEYRNAKEFKRTRYRLGLNYNTGFLDLYGTKIDSYFGSVGIGLPMSRQSNNMLNISYSYGVEGTVEGRLIQENYHKLSVNLSFFGNWFRKRKID